MARRNRVRRHRLHVLLPSEAGPVGRFLTSRAGVLLIALLALAAGFLLGRVTDSAADVRAEQQVRDIKAEFSRKLRNEREKAAVKAKEYVIIEEASAKLQVENQELLASMAALDDRVAFFKRMASPKAAAMPVDIDLFELLPGPAPGVVRYRLLITRNNPSGAVLQGSVRVRLQGAGGRHQDMTLDQPRIQLRYYQQFSGEWAVPAGFTPERVDIQIKGGSSTVERRFKWEVKNR
ncbi:DUF6776 family protein [Amnimonas aquatica]|uniref:Uncharacterized protein n=1 Tax=Amnimonas aquatica TaxID=2094561 RepID=A0A2P6AVB8_9GAMM|nr:DUF6776 family protein [Amnimonas aquatica]PQA52108.1 hypothetical protein C5O18_00720 [Amnimonas aquatica]